MQRKSYFMFLPFMMVILLSFNLTFAQGIIVNEASQGTDGTKEFIELLVVGSNTLTTASVDLTGWIIDDNNGDFEGVMAGVGISDGHIKITGTCLNNVHPGDLIVIYNDGDKNTNIPADDPTDSNNDHVYIFPISHACFSQCTTIPNTGDGAYVGCALGTPATWDKLGLRNSGGGDAVQIRKPDASFFHGFSYNGVNAPFPNFPSSMTSSFNIGTMNANDFVAMGCGNGAWESSTNYSVGTNDAANDTPGAANNAANTILIEEIRAGGFDYDDFSNPDNCDGIILPVELISFMGNRKHTDVILNWATTSETDNDHFDIEKSSNGHDFEKIGSIQGKGTTLSIQKYQFTHPSENYKTEYYRLKQVDLDATSTYSPVIAISPMQKEGLNLETYPQPFQNTLKLNFNLSKEEHITISIYNTLGEIIHHQKEFYQKGENELTISTQKWSLGSYFVQIKNQTEVITKRIFKVF